MIGFVASLASIVKVNSSKVVVDDAVFKLHYKCTSTISFFFCILVMVSDFIGEAIQCLEKSELASPAKTTYCWVSSTYTINTTKNGVFYEAYGSDFFGLGQYDKARHEKRVHLYYQWVPAILFLQGCMFYLPHQFWKYLEGKRVFYLLQGMNVICLDESSLVKKKNNIVRYLRATIGYHDVYSLGYLFCQILNVFNVLLQMYILDSFLGGVFIEFGVQVLKYQFMDDDVRHDPLIYNFPRVTQCDFYSYGDSGTIQKQALMCILPHNNMNEKIFVVLWFWFIFLAVVSLFKILYDLLYFAIPHLRALSLEARGKTSTDAETLVRYLPLGDVCLLNQIVANLDAVCVRDITKGLVDEISKHSNSMNKYKPFSSEDLYPEILKRHKENTTPV